MWGRTRIKLGLAALAGALVVAAVVAGQVLPRPGSPPSASPSARASIVIRPAGSAGRVDWAGVSQSGTWWASRLGVAFVSADQGEHWIQAPLPASSAIPVIVDASNIWALAPGADGGWSAFRTRDGGSTWAPSTVVGDGEPGQVANFVIADVERAEVLVTDTTGYGAEVWRTIDGGANWVHGEKIRCPARCTEVRASDESTFWLVGEGYETALHVSRDAGATWSSAQLPLEANISALRFFTSDSGVVASLRECPAGECGSVTFLVTADGGRSWSAVEVPNRDKPAIEGPATWSVVTRNDGSQGGGAPPTPLPLDGKVLRTTDGGRTWTEMPYVEPFAEPRYRPQFFGTRGYWLRQAGGGDVLYVTSDGGASWSAARFP